jgi:phenylalanine-4-hydroxylase
MENHPAERAVSAPVTETPVIELKYDHPGLHDMFYRVRRNYIGQLAAKHQDGQAIPDIRYTPNEHKVWAHVREKLEPLHRSLACKEYLEGMEGIALPKDKLPQLGEVNQRLRPATGFRLLPVSGFVEGRFFLSRLAQGIFLSTQYVRYPSDPLFSPEPDVIHELLGHATTLIHPKFARLSRAFGQTAALCADETIDRIARVYWYTLEAGLVLEDGLPKVFGAALLTSISEISGFLERAELRPLNFDEMAVSEYNPTDFQRLLFVAPSFDQMSEQVIEWLAQQVPQR